MTDIPRVAAGDPDVFGTFVAAMPGHQWLGDGWRQEPTRLLRVRATPRDLIDASWGVLAVLKGFPSAMSNRGDVRWLVVNELAVDILDWYWDSELERPVDLGNRLIIAPDVDPLHLVIFLAALDVEEEDDWGDEDSDEVAHDTVNALTAILTSAARDGLNVGHLADVTAGLLGTPAALRSAYGICSEPAA